MNRFAYLFILFFLFNSAAYGQNLVLCWIFEMQGCEGVEDKPGRAINMGNNGSKGIGATGAKRESVERRTIITIPDHKIRKIKRFFGLGGNRINISYEHEANCRDDKTSLPGLEDTFLRVNLQSCLRALERDLANSPRGIELNVLQCQDYFCQPQFLERFKLFSKKHPQYQVSNPERFLSCSQTSELI